MSDTTSAEDLTSARALQCGDAAFERDVPAGTHQT